MTRAAVRLSQVCDRGVDERPEDLGEQLIARADPAVDRRPVDVEAPGQGLHVDALADEKGPACQAEGVERGRPHGRGSGQLALQRRADVTRCHLAFSSPC